MRSGSATDSGPRSWGAALALAVEGVVTSCRKEGQGGEEERRRGGEEERRRGGEEERRRGGEEERRRGGEEEAEASLIKSRPHQLAGGEKRLRTLIIQYIGIKGHSECKWINKR